MSAVRRTRCRLLILFLSSQEDLDSHERPCGCGTEPQLGRVGVTVRYKSALKASYEEHVDKFNLGCSDCKGAFKNSQ